MLWVEAEMSELLDNRRFRLERLKSIVRRLHAGEDPEALRREFGALLDEVGASEIAALEDELMAEGIPEREIRRMCDLHAALLAGGRADVPSLAEVPGHPAHTLRAENARIRELVAAYRDAAGRVREEGSAEAIAAWREAHRALEPVEHHYRRKELLIFPFLEKAGLVGPPKVMWGVDDEIRERIRAVRELLGAAEELDRQALALAVDTVVLPMLDQVESMTEKEDRVLVPMALEHLAETDWGEIAAQWRELGPMLVEPAGVWLPPLPVLPARPAEVAPADAIRLPSGHLTLRQLRAILDTLPLDITFVDADDRVAYFSEGRERVFARSRTIIGRKVQNCHPPRSLHIVERIVDELRSGARDVAEFWIRHHGRFVHIRYFAVRDRDGTYLGTLEVTQDVTAIRALEGERRLLDDAPAEAMP